MAAHPSRSLSGRTRPTPRPKIVAARVERLLSERPAAVAPEGVKRLNPGFFRLAELGAKTTAKAKADAPKRLK